MIITKPKSWRRNKHGVNERSLNIWLDYGDEDCHYEQLLFICAKEKISMVDAIRRGIELLAAAVYAEKGDLEGSSYISEFKGERKNELQTNRSSAKLH